jgi:D-beta-D-heptose 7-phosphate kinase/D-beta-D-heptose 1-phosphate adenosyltransferase
MKIVICSGGFDPIHSGHIAYFRSAKRLGDTLVVGVNSDAWLTRKKGKPFMNFNERMEIVQSIKYVDYVMSFNDDDDSAILLIDNVKKTWPQDEIIFANGGDRNTSNNREAEVKGVTFAFGVGGSHKMNSSSEILKLWNN